MFTLNMTRVEYKAYRLYLKGIKVILKSGKNLSRKVSLDRYPAIPENKEELDNGLNKINAGRITYFDPEKLWISIK